ncbi:MAG TPA: SRPBCC family protein, partial [Steroidobacteraceae bacterium]|nr:SRPBCC family protein [Steroidobacteraceae bacterium]
GHAVATVLVHASPSIVAGLIRSCPEMLKLVPGLVECRVLETAPDGSWQIVRHVENYSWLLPKLTYDIRASWEGDRRVSIERVGGDLRVLRGSWQLEPQGDDTLAHYDLDLAPGFWVPRWMVKLALRHDLPKMLRALRARAEQLEAQSGHGAAMGAAPASAASDATDGSGTSP